MKSDSLIIYTKNDTIFYKIIGIPFTTLPVNMYIKHSSLWSYPITPKHNTKWFKNIETQKEFTPDVFQFISVHSIKRTDESFFITGYLLLNVNIFLVYHHFWNRKPAIFNTNFITSWIQLLKIIFLRIQNFNLKVLVWLYWIVI